MNVVVSSIVFLLNSGTIAPSSGYPTTNTNDGLSFSGLFSRGFRNPMRLGVYGSETSPALWIAAIKIPVAIPTESRT